MGNTVNSFSELLGQTWNSCVETFEGCFGGQEDELIGCRNIKKVSSNDAANAYSELRRLSASKKAELIRATGIETKELDESPHEPQQNISGLSAPAGDDYLASKYQELDTSLETMMTQVNQSTRETLGLKPGQSLPRPMTVTIGVSTDASGLQTLRVQSIKAGSNFRHRINHGIPRYLTSADLSVAAQQTVKSEMVSPEVDLGPIKDGQHRIAITLNPDGSYEVVQQQPSYNGNKAVGS